MAGRGTDIILGGNINFKIQKKLYDILTLSKNYILSKKKYFRILIYKSI
jgi:preprotein translocase subunit SecA